MATMTPPVPRPRANRAELTVYNALRDSLPDRVAVVHGATWYASADVAARTRCGAQEADFVILHPDLGILVLETKTGTFRVDELSDRWTHVDLMRGSTHPYENPLRQAVHNMHSLRAALERRGLHVHRHRYGYAVALPDAVYDSAIRSDALPRPLCLTSEDLASPDTVRGWVSRAYDYFATGDDLRPWEVAAVLDTLYDSPVLAEPIQSHFSRVGRVVENLTTQQHGILEVLRLQTRATISGCAGSGKTLVALEKAFRMSRAGFSTLFVCHSTHLATHLKRATSASGVCVVDFTGFVRSIASSLPSFSSDKRVDNPREAANRLHYLAMAAPDIFPRYDAIIVDEGQDIPEHGLSALEHRFIRFQCDHAAASWSCSRFRVAA